jgi:DNA-binding NarL/FixJ family response regulator
MEQEPEQGRNLMHRIAILADDAATAEGFRRGLRRPAGFQVVCCVEPAEHCGPALAQALPDVVVIDEMGADAAALDRIREARLAAPAAKLVLLTRGSDPQWLEQASFAGIDAAVSKALSAPALWALVRHVVAENVFHAFARPQAEARPNAAGLTDRELEVLRLVASGLSNARIAAQLWVTEQTVKFHLSNTYRKLGVTSRTQASHYAYTLRLLEVRPAPPATAEHAA